MATAGKDKGKTSAGTPPASSAGGSSAYGNRDDSFTLQAVMEMQKTLGKLDHAVTLLVASESATKEKIGRIEKVIYASGVVLLICLSLGGWMLSAAKDFAMTYYKASLEMQHRQVPAQPPQNQTQQQPSLNQQKK